MRVVVELKKDAVAEVVLNNLYKATQMQVSFGVQLLAIVQNRPRTMNLKELLEEFLAFRKESSHAGPCSCCGRRKAGAYPRGTENRSRPHRRDHQTDPGVEGAEGGQGGADGPLRPSEIQAQAILDMQLRRLTGLEREKILQELKEVRRDRTLKKILAEETELLRVIGRSSGRSGTPTGRAPLGDPAGDQGSAAGGPDRDEEMVVTVSHTGYIKRNPISLYRTQRRGGAGRSAWDQGGGFRLHALHRLDARLCHVLLRPGKCYWLKVHELPEAGRASKGRPS